MKTGLDVPNPLLNMQQLQQMINLLIEVTKEQILVPTNSSIESSNKMLEVMETMAMFCTQV
jgi:hypothetical protein